MKWLFPLVLLVGVTLAQEVPPPQAVSAAADPAPIPAAPIAAPPPAVPSDPAAVPAAPAGSPVAPAAPGKVQAPMFATHDFASVAMHERMKLANGEKCDLEFGSKLEVVVNEMEQNKDGSEEHATKLKNQFKELLEKSADKNLCLKESWCDMGVCKVRGPDMPKPVIHKGRGMAKGRGMQQGRGVDAVEADTVAPGGEVVKSSTTLKTDVVSPGDSSSPTPATEATKDANSATGPVFMSGIFLSMSLLTTLSF